MAVGDFGVYGNRLRGTFDFSALHRYNSSITRQGGLTMNIHYIRSGDYFIPNLELPEETRPIGKWG